MAYQMQTKYKDDLDELIDALSEESSKTLTTINSIVESQKNIAEAFSGSTVNKPSDVNLTFVPNWEPAKKSTAIKGRSTNAFISPKRLDEYVDANLYQPLSALFDAAADKLV